MNVEAELELEKSCWIAARVAEDPDNKLRILPRGLSVFAHTNPVYFIRAGKKIKEEASINYLSRYVRGTIHWLQTNPSFDNPDDRIEALKLAGDALQIYDSLIK